MTPFIKNVTVRSQRQLEIIYTRRTGALSLILFVRSFFQYLDDLRVLCSFEWRSIDQPAFASGD